MASPEHHDLDDLASPGEGGITPRHGFQGDRAQAPPHNLVPPGLSVAVSRESGSRGSSIARRAAQKLGWQVFDQDVLEYLAQEGGSRHDLAGGLSPEATRWADDRLQELLRSQSVSQHPSVVALAHTVLALGARGEVVLIGRGAGNLLPAASTLHVRVVAPLAERVGYMSQWLRLTAQAAAEQVHLRDRRRAEFLTTHFHQPPTDVCQYDLLLNSSFLGEDLCAELIAQAARAKQAGRMERS